MDLRDLKKIMTKHEAQSKISFFQKVDPVTAKKRNISVYNQKQQTAENMSYWFPAIENSPGRENSILKLPKTIVIDLGLSLFNWLRSDNYKDDQIKAFNEILKQQLILDGTFSLEGDLPLFMKTGVYSNKFNYQTTQIQSLDEIGSKALEMFYSSMCLGADHTTELVFRELIKDKEDSITIYDGMPLHTEFRVFYDFDKKEIVGVSNYWHPDVMKPNLNAEDLSNYLTVEEKILSEFDEFKYVMMKEVKQFMEGCVGLEGKWSIDVMKNGDDFWLIDMARMELSALVAQMEAYKEES